ncbi:transposase, partial [uncultured Arthrobacter sp.]|uniref:transposase n=1 Tax=uncultured Arthrobacter sp. TaxID=114050 RepID=UPI0026153CBD
REPQLLTLNNLENPQTGYTTPRDLTERISSLIMATSKFPQELRERATRLAVEARRDPATRSGAIARIAGQTGLGEETLRNWVRKAEDADLPVESVDAAVQIRQLQAENRELRRSNEILRSATAFFAKAEFDRPQK